MTIINEAPIKYRSNVKKAEITYIKVPCKNVTGDPIKEEVPKFLEKKPENIFFMH